jgi:hypothetical protein
MTRPTRVLALLLLAALAACGGGGADDVAVTATTESAGPPTCPVDATDVVAATGFELAGDVRVDVQGGDVFCVFDAADGLSNVAMTIWRDPGGELFDGLSDVPGSESVELDFADEAVWSAAGSTLYARIGDEVATVGITDVDQVVGDPLGATSELAEIALG